MVTAAPDVLVVGAGPTGLALALQAHDHGARVRVVERRPDPVRPSRALLVHPRTLEVLRPLGVTGELMDLAVAALDARLHLGTHTVRVRLAELALPGTAFPPLTLLRQRDVERVLADALSRRGIRIERDTELVGLAAGSGQARATLRSAVAVEELVVPAVVGCDGVDSTVRRLTGIGWPGGCYRREVVLADADLAGDLGAGAAHVVPGRRGLVFAFPLGEGADWRLVATRPAGRDGLPPGRDGPPLPPAELQALLDEAGLDARITRCAWSTRVCVQHRVAARYRHGPVFLAGDATHASSPAGGQGLNTGIQDATNLGWKLALAGRSTDPDALLDSYENERRPVAHRTLALTHALFWAESATDPLATLLRGTLAPLAAPLLPALLRSQPLTEAGLLVLSGLRIGYRGSRLSAGGLRRPDRLHAGDRLPDVPVTWDGGSGRLHELLAGPGVHVLLDRDAPSPARVAGPWTTVHRLTSSPGMGVVAVRPDGHVGFLSRAGDAEGLGCWLALAGTAERPMCSSNSG